MSSNGKFQCLLGFPYKGGKSQNLPPLIRIHSKDIYGVPTMCQLLGSENEQDETPAMWSLYSNLGGRTYNFFK